MTAEEILARHQAALDRRRPLEPVWQDCYAHVLPPIGQGGALFDATAADAAEQLAASLLAELTPPWSRWFGLSPARPFAEGEAGRAMAEALEDAAATLQGHFDFRICEQPFIERKLQRGFPHTIRSKVHRERRTCRTSRYVIPSAGPYSPASLATPQLPVLSGGSAPTPPRTRRLPPGYKAQKPGSAASCVGRFEGASAFSFFPLTRIACLVERWQADPGDG